MEALPAASLDGFSASGSAAAGTVALGADVGLELCSTLVLCYVLTEVCFAGRSLWEVRRALAAWPACYLVLSPAPRRAAWVVLSTCSALLVGSRTEVPAGARAAADFAEAGVPSVVARGVLRVLAALVGFSALLYIDVKRLRPAGYTWRTFAGELWRALRLLLPVFPFLVMGFSFVLLVLTSILEVVGLPERVAEVLIIYGQFYAPFGMLYAMIKQDWLQPKKGETVLPLHRSGLQPATSRGFVLGRGSTLTTGRSL